MSTREKTKVNKKRARGQDPGPITRRQQVAAIRQIKGTEIAAAVANNIRSAVEEEVTRQVLALKDTMFNLIDRVTACELRLSGAGIRRAQDEGDSDDRPERTEGTPVLEDDEVVQGSGLEGDDHCGQDYEEGPEGR